MILFKSSSARPCCMAQDPSGVLIVSSLIVHCFRFFFHHVHCPQRANEWRASQTPCPVSRTRAFASANLIPSPTLNLPFRYYELYLYHSVELCGFVLTCRMCEPRSVVLEVPKAAGPRTETEGRKRRGPVVSNCSLRCTRTYMLAHLNRPRIVAQLGGRGLWPRSAHSKRRRG